MKLYDELASWWPLLSRPSDYAEEAGIYERVLRELATADVRSLLELGSGGGNNASFLKRRFDLVLVDSAPGMLAVSRALNPECEHIEGDMRWVDLGRRFDAVFVHDAVVYMRTEEDLRAAIGTAFRHCRPGGAALFAPDHLVENYRPETTHGGHDGAERSLRYLSWSYDPDPSDSTYTVDYAYLLRDHDGSTRVEHDRHIEGLFPRATWLRLLEEAGFLARAIPFEHTEIEAGSHELFACRRPETDTTTDGSLP